ncbi:MAG: DegV family protein [Mycoplasmoidaceae bacterium]
MKKVAVIMDTWSTFYEDQKDGHHIYFVKLIIIENNNKNLIEYEDYLEINQKEIIDKENIGIKISTSLPNFANSLAKLEGLLKEYENIIIIPTPKVVSGTYDTWRTVIDMLDKKDQGRVYLKDYHDIGPASYFAVIDAFNLTDGHPNQAIEMIKYFESRQWFTFFLMSDINSLIKSGRLNILKGTLAKILKKKVSITFEGEFKKISSSSKISKNVEQSLIYAKNRFIENKWNIKRIIILKTELINEDLKDFTDSVKKFFTKKNQKEYDIKTLDCANVLVAHFGPKILGLYVEFER